MRNRKIKLAVVMAGVAASMAQAAPTKDMTDSQGELGQVSEFSKQNNVRIVQVKKPVKNENKIRYVIYFNLNDVSNNAKKSFAERGFDQVEHEEALADLTSNTPEAFKRAVQRDPDAWHQPGARSIKKKIEQRYGVKLDTLKSWLESSARSWMTLEEAEAVSRDESVSWVAQLEEDEKKANFSAPAPAPGDTYIGSEIVPWYRAAVNMNDNASVSVPFYLIDSVLDYNKVNSELNLVRYDGNLSSPTFNNVHHATHVAGLVGARANGLLMRGVNPGQPIMHYDRSGSDLSIAAEKAAAAAEYMGQFPVLNYSSNLPGFRDVFLKLSNRFFIAQSAGNIYSRDGTTKLDACESAFSYWGYVGNEYLPRPRPDDGIMVVSGLDATDNQMGSIYPVGDSEYGVTGVASGPCVEAWAPAHRITSLKVKDVPSATTHYLSGTSFAAPLVAAMASRYGTNKTRPIEREESVRRHLVATNTSDKHGGAIKKIYYNSQNDVFARYFNAALKRFPIKSIITASNMANTGALYDEKFYSESYYWKAGSNRGSVTVNLGSPGAYPRIVKGVRLTVRKIHKAPSWDSYAHDMAVKLTVVLNPGKIGQEKTIKFDRLTDFEPIYISGFNDYDVQEIKITGETWTGTGLSSVYDFNLAEIEVYGISKDGSY